MNPPTARLRHAADAGEPLFLSGTEVVALRDCLSDARQWANRARRALRCLQVAETALVPGSPSWPVLHILEGTDTEDRGVVGHVIPNPGPFAFRVVDTDNLGGDYPDEKFVGPPMSRKAAETIANTLNAESNPNAARFHKVVPVGYELQPGFEP